MGVAKTDRFGSLRLGRRTVLRMMVLTVAGLMSLGAVGPARADDTQDSFWTQFTPSSDTRLIFVSSSEGNDANSGLTPAQPVATIAKGYELLRDRHPDWMLLKRGDTWNETLPNWGKSGRSESEKLILGAYGNSDERPRIRPPLGQLGMNVVGNTLVSHVALVGFDLRPAERSTDSAPLGIRWLRRANDLLFEDLYVGEWGGNITIQAWGDGAVISNARINGCVVANSWSTVSHSQGMYVSGVRGLVVENSVFASNGHNSQVGAGPSIFNHNAYIQNGNSSVVVRNNIFADASSHGIQMRSGGVAEGNLFVSNPLSLQLGGGDEPDAGGVSAEATGNLVMYGRGIKPGTPRAFGILMSNVREAAVRDNIICHSVWEPNGFPMSISQEGPFASNISIFGNTIVGWYGSLQVANRDGHVHADSRIAIVGNRFIADLSNDPTNSGLQKPLIEANQFSSPPISFGDNRYAHFSLHSSPFRVAHSWERISIPQWVDNFEPSASFEQIPSLPANLHLADYLAAQGISGDTNSFIVSVKNRSRLHTDPIYTAGAVIRWYRDRLEAP